MNETSLLQYKNCCMSLHRLGYQYIFICLQIKYLSVVGPNLDENSNFGRNWWFWTDEKWHFGNLDSMFVQSLQITK